jgi:hypothetical protein
MGMPSRRETWWARAGWEVPVKSLRDEKPGMVGCFWGEVGVGWSWELKM